jgi:uncharacterized protein (TIGR02599 family)
MKSCLRRNTVLSRGFTLIELLLSMTIFSIVLLVTASMLDSTMTQLRIADARFSQFQETQAAFESMNLRITGCELNPYYDYVYPGNNTATVPTSYKLSSDLHFVCGPARGGTLPLLPDGNRAGHGVFFHGTLGLSDQSSWQEMKGLVNSWGYYLEFGDDKNSRANFLNTSTAPSRRRFRLKELQVPAEQLRTYALKLSAPGTSAGALYDWFRTPASIPLCARTVAENVVALVITPLRPDTGGTLNNDLAPTYFYDSRAYQHTSGALAERTRHRLPPLLQITLVALDEVSAQQLEDKHGDTMPDLGLDGLFLNANRYRQDLQALESTLQDRKLRYRVFTNTIRLRNARWTETY